jgi:DYW family of nucleic acid deaminases
VLLANIYAKKKNWSASKQIRDLMDERGVKKAPGKSWIEVNGKISYFLVNDKSHPLSEQIYNQLDQLKARLKRSGFSSDTCYITHDIAEEQKQDLIWYHSEKLALAYGLLKIPPNQQITIINNLHVCGDCHAALEFISKVYNRDIVVCDSNRFHHFHSGRCSCKGYF